MATPISITEAVLELKCRNQADLNHYMPGNPRYQPEELKVFLGYDAWACWLAIVEWFWLQTLAARGVMSAADSALLNRENLRHLLYSINTTAQDKIEAETKHDILALLEIMKKCLPRELHRWLHYGATSYDIISTAYALQAKVVFEEVFCPALLELDSLWRQKISLTAYIIQPTRTHLQTAVPGTVGFGLSPLHSRFADTAEAAWAASQKIVGKFSGAAGTKAPQRLLLESGHLEGYLMARLGLQTATLSTQIAPPESLARFYFELVLLSGALANMGEDVRILQSSQFGELTSVSSTSSAMSHKTANPIAAENVAGMHESVKAEFGHVLATLVSDLQRDLRGSSVMRQHSAVMVYVFSQIKTAIRLMKSLGVDETRCLKNFEVDARLVVAEALHLELQRLGLPDAHSFVNKQVVPKARAEGLNLHQVMDGFSGLDIQEYWRQVPDRVKQVLLDPKQYIGYAVEMAEAESNRVIRIGR